MKAKRKPGWQIDQRVNGNWLPLGSPYATKQEAQRYAATSYPCQRDGYQIRKVKT